MKKLINQLTDKLAAEIQEEERRTLRDRINAGEFRCNADRLRFRSFLEQEQGTTGHPKAQHLWDLAWEHGHANGYLEVCFWYSELKVLID